MPLDPWDALDPWTPRLEAWLSQTPDSIRCWVVDDDERTKIIVLNALSLMGCQREISGMLVARGFEPLQRWQYHTVRDIGGGDFQECSRNFRRKVPRGGPDIAPDEY